MSSIITLKLAAVQWAREAAEHDLKFSGDRAIAKLGLSADAAADLRAALLFYAESAATRTVSSLKLHGHLRGV